MGPALFPSSPQQWLTVHVISAASLHLSHFHILDYLILPNFVVVLVKNRVSHSFVFSRWLLVYFSHLLYLLSVWYYHHFLLSCLSFNGAHSSIG